MAEEREAMTKAHDRGHVKSGSQCGSNPAQSGEGVRRVVTRCATSGAENH